MIMSHLPTCVCVCIGGLERAAAVEQGKDVSLNMPLWVTAGTRLNVAGESTMSLCPERFADLLALLTGNENIHYTFLHSRSICSRSTSICFL